MTRLLLSVFACCAVSTIALADEPVSPFAQPDQIWRLSELGGATFDKDSTLIFGTEGNVAGKALCNRFMGRAEWTPESLSIGPLGSTMMACPDLEQEQIVMQALSSVARGGIVDDRLILTLQDGSEMVYVLGTDAP